MKFFMITIALALGTPADPPDREFLATECVCSVWVHPGVLEITCTCPIQQLLDAPDKKECDIDPDPLGCESEILDSGIGREYPCKCTQPYHKSDCPNLVANAPQGSIP